jgi:heterodisulfide reductase subunit B
MNAMELAATLERNTKARPATLAETVKAKIGENVNRCWQCAKCTSGCPLADQFDLTPNQVMRALQLNDESVLASKTIWLCSSCYTCATRCPRDIDVTGVMDALRIEAKKRGIAPAIREIPAFNMLFMWLVRIFGRLPEALLMLGFNLVRGKPFKDMRLGMQLFVRGRLNLLPKFARAPKSVAALGDAGAKIGYFPGCASEGSASDYGRTVRMVARALDIDLVEPKGWTCCGSSPAHATDQEQAVVMPMRSIATIERMGIGTLTTACSACFIRLKTVEHDVGQDAAKREMVAGKIGYTYGGKVRVQHLLDALMERPERIAARVKRPLTGLKVACYYGCLITRPSRITGAEHPEYPMKMDYLVRALGAEPIAWSGKTDCCGSSLGVAKTEVSLKMANKVLTNARACGADIVVTMCPMCHINLDARQHQLGFEAPTPIVYATHLMLLAFGEDNRTAEINRAITDPAPLCRRIVGDDFKSKNSTPS